MDIAGYDQIVYTVIEPIGTKRFFEDKKRIIWRSYSTLKHLLRGKYHAKKNIVSTAGSYVAFGTINQRLWRAEVSSIYPPLLLNSFTVTPSAGENGTISPDTAQIVRKGDRTSFTVTPATNYTIESVGGTCGGSLDGNTYTTDAVTADCTVEANFIESNAEFDYISVVTDPGRNEWDVPLSAEEPLVLEVSVTQPGIWSATTDTVNGVTYRGSGTFSGQGNQMISLYGSGTPLAYGVHSYSVAGSGLSTNVTTICASYLAPENTEIVEVTGAAGRVWMDRNLGAHRAAETFNDCRAYGNNFQWGSSC